MGIHGRSSLAHRVAALAGAMIVGLMGMATAEGAMADVPSTSPDSSTPTTLTINKFDGAQGDPGDGTRQDTSGFGKPLKDVEFTITQVMTKNGTNIDLNKSDGWNLINGIHVNDVVAPTYTFGEPKVVRTNIDGVVSEPLQHGLYLVKETGHGGNTVISDTAPFLVTLPLPKADGSWLYDVNVYPKNQVLGAPVKTVNTTVGPVVPGFRVGDDVEYTITQTVPRLNDGESYTQALIYDHLNGEELRYDATTAVKLNGTRLPATDYSVANDGSSWGLTQSGLAKIKAGDILAVVFTASVRGVSESGAIKNGPGSGDVGALGYGSTFNGVTTPGATIPYTYWGQLQIQKNDSNDKPLAGAQFAVTTTFADGSCPARVTGSPLETGNSGIDGVVRWGPASKETLGLFVANSNNDQLEPAPSKAYCLYETQAPAGYVIGSMTHKITITAGATNTKKITIENQRRTHPDLPLTGASGALVMMLGGIALVLAGAVVYMVVRRRNIH